MMIISNTKPRNPLCMECINKRKFEKCDSLPNQVDLSLPEVKEYLVLLNLGQMFLFGLTKRWKEYYSRLKDATGNTQNKSFSKSTQGGYSDSRCAFT
jgi:hypothetical protein